MTNKVKYTLLNGHNIIGIVYESDTYGRTLVLQGELDPNYDLKVWNIQEAKLVTDVDLMEFIHSLLPK